MKYLYRKGVTGRRFNARNIKASTLVVGVFSAAVLAASLNFAGNRAAATVPGTNTRVSLTGAGAQSSADSNSSSISRDGRFVVFGNPQNYFVGTDFNNVQDIFVRNISANTVVRASVSTAGVGANQYSAAPVISETGRYVVFSSASSNLIDGRTITTGDQQLYMRDMVSNTTTILTEVSSGTFANSPTYASDVSSDGRFVLFRSYATNLGPTMSGGSHYNVFLLDRATNTTTWVNAVASGSTGGDPYDAHMSCDGSLIVFDGSASYLGLPGGSHFDVFLLDRRGGSRLTNITGSANGAAVSPRISCNGNYIGFSSYASNLDPITAGMTLYYHIYNYDRINDQFSLVDQTTGGVLANAPVGIAPTAPLFFSISDKGSSVFGSTATNLDAAATAGQRQLFIRDPNAGTTELLTRDSGGTEGDDESRIASISLDGKTAAYDSYATNLVSGDSNSQRDIFVSATGL